MNSMCSPFKFAIRQNPTDAFLEKSVFHFSPHNYLSLFLHRYNLSPCVFISKYVFSLSISKIEEISLFCPHTTSFDHLKAEHFIISKPIILIFTFKKYCSNQSLLAFISQVWKPHHYSLKREWECVQGNVVLELIECAQTTWIWTKNRIIWRVALLYSDLWRSKVTITLTSCPFWKSNNGMISYTGQAQLSSAC